MVLQGHGVYDALRAQILQGFDRFPFEASLAQLSNSQTQCERLKLIPIPRPYTFFTRLCVWVFIVIVPFCFVQTFDEISHAACVIPLTVLLAYVFGIVE
jgi:ion channel-forming bestrophin family protein